jgi:hypothetical protein
LAVNPVTVSYQDRFEANHKTTVLRVSQLHGQLGDEAMVMTHDTGKAGECSVSGNEVVVTLGDSEVAFISIHAQEGDHQGDGQEFIVAGFLAFQARQSYFLLMQASRWSSIHTKLTIIRSLMPR